MSELPRFKCHKVVQASKINHIAAPVDGAPVVIVNTHDGDCSVRREWLEKHNPQIGGYLVRYEDGYESYSPAEAFEAGYAKVPPSGDGAGCIAAETLRTRIENDFVYHAPKPGQAETYAYIRDQAKQLALELTELCPLGRELSTALTKLEEVVFWANASIARSKT